MAEKHPNFPDVAIKRERRRSMTLKVSPQGDLILRLPHWIKLSDKRVRDFLKQGVPKMRQYKPPERRKQIHQPEMIRMWTMQWASKMGVVPGRIQLRDMSRKWGSCSEIGSVTLNTALYYVPHDLVHYVIVHELAHLIHFDHSPQFWATVGQYIPDYERCEAALNEYQSW
ncbi:MAG: M48 family peptidase [Anaerolineaceae bacterium]|nr:MAG: M48 family peptidase [Anaerolineaceae bacterium]